VYSAYRIQDEKELILPDIDIKMSTHLTWHNAKTHYESGTLATVTYHYENQYVI